MATSAALGAVWVFSAWLFNIEMLEMAIVYGAVVSAVTVRWTRSSGISYQLAASLATFVGIGVSETLVNVLIVERIPVSGLFAIGWTEWPGYFEHAILENDLTSCFAVFGVLGGLYIWKPVNWR